MLRITRVSHPRSPACVSTGYRIDLYSAYPHLGAYVEWQSLYLWAFGLPPSIGFRNRNRQCAQCCTYLFVDETHHIKARTRQRFRGVFMARRVLQFSATRFRNDGQHVDGRVIFDYPLQRAREGGYFAPIRLLPVYEFDPDDAERDC